MSQKQFKFFIFAFKLRYITKTFMFDCINVSFNPNVFEIISHLVAGEDPLQCFELSPSSQHDLQVA